MRILVWPAALWMILFFVLPLLIVVGYSLLTPSSVYQATGPLTLDNYTRLAEPTYTLILLRSILTAAVTTVICVLIGYPLSFFIATRPKTTRNIFLLLVI